MAESRLLPSNFWSWPGVVNLLLDQKAILAYLWTSRFSTACGGFELPVRLAAAELGVTEPVLVEALKQFQALELVEFDESTCEVFIKGWFRFHKFGSGPQVQNFLRSKAKIQSSKILKLVVESSSVVGVPQSIKRGISLKNHTPRSQPQPQPQHKHELTAPCDEFEAFKKKGEELLKKKRRS